VSCLWVHVSGFPHWGVRGPLSSPDSGV
jgi:hypothetical protein